MKIQKQVESDVTILRPVGRIDASALPEFSAVLNRLINGDVKKILIDFSKTDYMSSAGIRAILEGYKGIEEKKGMFAICSVNENLKELFQVISLDKVLTIYHSEFEALDKMLT